MYRIAPALYEVKKKKKKNIQSILSTGNPRPKTWSWPSICLKRWMTLNYVMHVDNCSPVILCTEQGFKRKTYWHGCACAQTPMGLVDKDWDLSEKPLKLRCSRGPWFIFMHSFLFLSLLCQKFMKLQTLCTRQNGHRDKFYCYRRLHDQGRSSDNFENLEATNKKTPAWKVLKEKSNYVHLRKYKVSSFDGMYNW